MNAENRKLMSGLLAAASAGYAALDTALAAQASSQMEMSRRAPVVFSHRQPCARTGPGSVCRSGPEGFGPNLRRCHNPSITRRRPTVKQPSGVTVHLLCLFPHSSVLPQ